jgi:hypothetical protein
MALVKSSISIVGIVAGSLGAVICFTAITVLWIVSARLDRATGRLFSNMDHSLVLVRDRLSQSQERVAAAKITAQDVETALRDWTKQQTAKRIESRIQAAEKTEHLASALRQVDTWLDISESSVEIMSEVLAIAKSPSTPDESTLLEQFIAEISSLRTLCAEATQLADRVHERVAQASDENLLQERVARSRSIGLARRCNVKFDRFSLREVCGKTVRSTAPASGTPIANPSVDRHGSSWLAPSWPGNECMPGR